MSPRRQLLADLALMTLGIALDAQRTAFAQQPGRIYRLGLVTVNARTDWAHLDPYLVAFFQRLGELGFVEGRNLVIE